MKLAAAIALTAMLIPAAHADTTFQTHANGVLTVTTPRMEAVFRAGALIRLTDRGTGAAHVASDSGSPPSWPTLRYSGNREVAALGNGAWTVHEEEARYVETGDGSVFTLRLRVDPFSGDLVLTQTAAGPDLGARAVQWGIPSIPLAHMELIVPAYGGVHVDAGNPAREIAFDYPHNWEIQLAILQGAEGGFSVWSDDTTGQFKALRYRRRGDAFDLVLETENPGPFFDKSEVRSVTWRLNVHAGDWRVAAGRYRDWMERAFGLTRWAADASWAEGIGAMVIARNGNTGEAFLDELASRLVPERTLLYIPQWRKHAYDVLYPDYEAADWTRPFVQNAHAHGFRVMLHVNLPGISPQHPIYDDYRFYQVRNADNLGLMGWRWGSGTDVVHGFINAGLSRYRADYVDWMRLAASTGCDALHLDVSAPAWNDGNGPVEGMTYPAGVRELHRELKAALPEVVLGGENISELTLLHERFYQTWKARALARPHPIRTYLCAPFARPVGYLGVPNPDESPADFDHYQQHYEPWGVLPTISLGIDRPEQMEGPRTAALLQEARAWQEGEYRLDLDSAPRPGELLRWDGESGQTARLSRTHGESTALVMDGVTVWERIRGATTHETLLTIPSWPAHRGNRWFGLDPRQHYEARPIPRQVHTVGIRGLSPHVYIQSWRSDSTATAWSLAPVPGEPVMDLVKQFAHARTGVVVDGNEEPVQRGARFGEWVWEDASLENPILDSVCPWQLEGAEDRAWGEVFAEYAVPPEPEGVPLFLQLELAQPASALRGDGVTARVTVDGQTIFETWKKSAPWEAFTVPFPTSEGRSRRVRLAMDPGPNGDVGWDHLLWRGVRIMTREAEPAAATVQLIGVPSTVTAIGLQRTALEDPTHPEGDAFVMPATGSAVLFPADPPVVSGSAPLTDMPHTFGTVAGPLFHPGMSVWGGGHINDFSVEGQTIRGYNGHPPGEGKTLIRQIVRLDPSLVDPVLRVTASVRAGSQTAGVGFRILLNGWPVWTWNADGPGAWEVEMPLAGYQDLPLLIEWETDAMGDCSYDWAMWLNPRIAERR